MISVLPGHGDYRAQTDAKKTEQKEEDIVAH